MIRTPCPAPVSPSASGPASSPLVSEDNSLPAEVGAEIANAIVSKVVEAIVLVQHGDPGLAAALGGGAGGATKGLLAGAPRRWARRRRRVGLALDAAREHTGHCPMELLELAIDRDSDQAFEFFVRALQAAAREADDDRVRFYGRIAASGALAQDDAVVDEAERVFSTIAGLDAIDVKVLLALGEDHHTRWQLRTGVLPFPSFEKRFPEANNVLDGVIARLETAGMIRGQTDAETTYARTWGLTRFGVFCYWHLMGIIEYRPV
jgi:hypothetical protein